MAELLHRVYVKAENNEDVGFGPGPADDLPDWALDQIGDHAFLDGERTSSGTAKAYKDRKVDDLKAEIAKRNEGREEVDQISDQGKKDDLVAALEADAGQE